LAVPVLAAAAAAVAFLLVTREAGEAARSEDALEVSEEFAVALASHDAADLDRSFAAVRRLSTGGFLDDFEQTFASDQVRAALEDVGSKATAAIETGPLLADLDGERARTFTVVRQRITAREQPEPLERVVRVELVLVETDAGWKVDAVEVT
jgi:hypothetical protein